MRDLPFGGRYLCGRDSRRGWTFLSNRKTIDRWKVVCAGQGPGRSEHCRTKAGALCAGYGNTGRFQRSVLYAKGAGITGVDGILLDLGVSSYQLDTTERGFSYHQDAPLDMRMSKTGPSAQDLVNTYSTEDLSRIIREFGEEKYAWSIAKNIEKARAKAPITTTGQLAEIIRESMPYSARREKNPAKKTFQAIRIAVNGELDALSQVLDQAFDFLNPGGRFAIITFHSLEDRMVKQKFADFAKGCTCPPGFSSMYLREKAQGNTGQPKTDYADRKRIGGKSQKPQRKAAHRREKSGKIIKGSRKGEKNGLR